MRHSSCRLVVLTLCIGAAYFVAPTILTAQPSREQLAEINRLTAEGRRLFQQGKHGDALQSMEFALELCRKAYPKDEYPKGSIALAESLGNVGVVLHVSGQVAKARGYYEDSLQIYRQLYPKGTLQPIPLSFTTLLGHYGNMLGDAGEVQRAIPVLQEALDLRRQAFPLDKHPNGHHAIAVAMANLGGAYRHGGKLRDAAKIYNDALAMIERLAGEATTVEAQHDLTQALNNCGVIYSELGELVKAGQFLERAVGMTRQMFPPETYRNGHPSIANQLSNLGMLRLDQGENDRALANFEEALTMVTRLFSGPNYPRGHISLVLFRLNLASAWKHKGDAVRAATLNEEAVAAIRKLDPGGRSEVYAAAVGNSGVFFLIEGDFAKARKYFEEFREVAEKRFPADQFPQGHPILAQAYQNLGSVLLQERRPAEAQPWYERALAMRRTVLARDGLAPFDVDLARALRDLAFGLHQQSKTEQALPYMLESLEIYRGRWTRYASVASEAEALAFARTVPDLHGGLLAITYPLPPEKVDVYAQIWARKALVMRILEQRQLAARIALAAQPELAKTWEELSDVRSQIATLITRPAQALVRRDEQLAKLSDRRDTLERTLSVALPEAARVRQRDTATPRDLTETMPADDVLVDFFQYHMLDKGKRETFYVGFVLSKGRAARRVELGLARPIDQAINAWRHAIAERKASPAARQLRQLIWEKLAPHIPATARRLLIAPDGNLARIPWCALPGGAPDTVLLEEFTGGIASLPHAQFLLEAANRRPPTDEHGAALALGAVDYGGSGVYKELGAGAVELRQLAQAAGPRKLVSLTGDQASLENLRRELPHARYAHFATHGFFAEKELAVERQREADWLAKQDHGQGGRARPGTATRSPMSFTGLILAGANKHPERGILTGDALVQWPLDNLYLCVLSACETGLGDLTAAEGVQGLQRAFHLAGCPNVVGSLWNVNDAATAALMAKFYHELWVNKKPPIEALREAQLTIYRHPELIPDLAGERGAPRLKEAVAIKIGAKPGEPGEPSGVSRRTADTKLWAAFVLSGVGK